MWATHFERYCKWRVHDNPFDRNDYTVVEKWGCVRKATKFRGVLLAKHWNRKDEIITALNNTPDQPIVINN